MEESELLGLIYTSGDHLIKMLYFFLGQKGGVLSFMMKRKKRFGATGR